MLMGACGGLLSRLMRALGGINAPTDYGVSWTTLFLSPVLGAFSGWFGILIVNGFSDLQVLNPNITKLISFDGETLPTLGLAFVLGFSERLFDGLINAVDKTLLKEASGAAAPAPAATATAGISQNGAQTAIKEVKPDKPKAGEQAIIFGAMLDKANVDGIKLVMFGRQDLPLTILKQDATSIQFKIPLDTPHGKYTLTVTAKNSANVHTSIQVGDDPVPTVSENAESVKPGSTVTFSGVALDQVSVELHNKDDQPVEITGLVQSSDKIEFTAPATPGEYTLVVTPKKGDPIRRKFTVAN